MKKTKGSSKPQGMEVATAKSQANKSLIKIIDDEKSSTTTLSLTPLKACSLEAVYGLRRRYRIIYEDKLLELDPPITGICGSRSLAL